jgi:hypothetical protein
MSRRDLSQPSISPAHNAHFAVEPAGEGSAFTPIPGVDLDEILCVQEERQVGNDNCVSDRPERQRKRFTHQSLCQSIDDLLARLRGSRANPRITVGGRP